MHVVGEEPDRKVKSDAFHLLQRYSRSLSTKTDPMVGYFICLMMNAFFIVDDDDHKEVIDSLQKLKIMSDEEIGCLPRKFFSQKCRRCACTAHRAQDTAHGIQKRVTVHVAQHTAHRGRAHRVCQHSPCTLPLANVTPSLLQIYTFTI